MRSGRTNRMFGLLGAAVAAASIGAVEARAAGGRIVVKSDPAGASVYLDDDFEPRGVTPLDLKSIPSGLHKVRVALAGYTEQRRGFYLAAGGEREFSFDLAAAGEDDEPTPARRRAPTREPDPPKEREKPSFEKEDKPPKTIDVECPVCKGSKVIKTIGCENCKSTGYIDINDCPKCSGTRRVDYPCPACKGEGRMVVRGVEKECPYCKGEGYLPCGCCRGKGTIPRPNPEAASYPTKDCPLCNGSGFLQEEACRFCGGDGDIWIGRSAQTGQGGGGAIGGRSRGGVGTRQKVDCPYCDGTGKGFPLCRRCQGRGYQGGGKTLRPCPGCSGCGRAYLPCPGCRGRGYVRDRDQD